jgi:hypothetical protein
VESQNGQARRVPVGKLRLNLLCVLKHRALKFIFLVEAEQAASTKIAPRANLRRCAECPIPGERSPPLRWIRIKEDPLY